MMVAGLAIAGPNPYTSRTALAPALARDVAQDPFEWAPVPGEITVGAEGALELDLLIPEGCEVYRDRVSVTVIAAAGLQVGDLILPHATHSREVAGEPVPIPLLRGNARFTVPLQASEGVEGVQVVKLELRHQGCKGGLCYPEVVQVREALIRVVPAPAE